MVFSRLSAVMLLSLVLSETRYVLGQELPSEIVLFVTYRDFLPIWCLNDDNVPNGKDTIRAAWDINEISLQNGNRDACGRFLDDIDGLDNSDYKAALVAGNISGHPDFEAQGHFSEQVKCTAVDPETNLNFPVGTCIHQFGDITFSVVALELAEGDSGLPLIQYCTDVDGADSRCGFTGEARPETQTTKEFFDVWYNDDEKYNRRIGQRIALTAQADDESTFEFVDTGADSPDFPDEETSNGAQFGPLDIFKIGGTREVFIEETPAADCAAWPQSASNAARGGSVASLSRGFWFTTEIHTTFEFREDEDMVFTFSGDDDFWAFINGQMAVDVGGMHGSREQTIDLNAGADTSIDGVTFANLLELEDGEVYTLDIYHAERQRSGSNFKLTTSLFAACNVQQSGGESVDFRTVGFDQESFDKRFRTQGAEFIDSRSFQLLKSSDIFASNLIYTRDQENIGAGFDAKFLARIDGDTEGFAFVIQSAGLLDYPRAFGRTFNFNIPNSLAVVFDLCATRNSQNECSSQQVRVHFPDDPSSSNNAEDIAVADGGTRRVFANILRNLKRDEAFPVEVVFFGEKPNFLEVYVNNSLYLRQSGFDVESAIGTAGAHVGFTSSTLDLAANIFIEDFSLSIVEVDSTRTAFVEGQEENNQTVIADGESLSEGFVIFTEDACTNTFESGSLDDLIFARYIEQPNEFGEYNSATELSDEERAVRRLQEGAPLILEAEIQDNLDGTYNLQLKTTVPAEYKLVLAFGTENCELEFDESIENRVINDDIVAVTVVTPRLVGSLEDCSFVSDFDGQLFALEVPPPPTNAPIVLEEAEEEFDIIPFAASGGGVCCLLIVFVIIFASYRAKWKREKDYVDPGNAYKLDINTLVAGGEDYTKVGRALLQSQKEILALQSGAKQDPREGEIKQLTRENEEMKNMLKGKKKETDVAHIGTDSSAAENPKYKPKRTKQEF